MVDKTERVTNGWIPDILKGKSDRLEDGLSGGYEKRRIKDGF